MTNQLLRASLDQMEAMFAGPRPSTAAAAALSKCTHQQRRSLGYLDHGQELPLPAVLTHKGTECYPPGHPPDGSLHWLRPPGRAVPMGFRWVARERAWERPGGHRMAFRATYLAHHGWRYVGAAT